MYSNTNSNYRFNPNNSTIKTLLSSLSISIATPFQ